MPDMPGLRWWEVRNAAAGSNSLVTSAATNSITLAASLTAASGCTVTTTTINAFLSQAYTIVTQWGEDDYWPTVGTITGAPFVPRKRTEAEIQAELRARADYERRTFERHAAEQAAKLRAEKLLLENLTSEQRDTLVGRGFFDVRSKTGKRYRIERSTHGNIHLLNANGNATHRLCAQPSGVPVDDAILAQKLALEADEESFLKVANVTRY